MEIKVNKNKTFTTIVSKTVTSCNNCPFKTLHWTTQSSYNYCSKGVRHDIKVDGNSRVNHPVKEYFIDARCPILKTK